MARRGLRRFVDFTQRTLRSVRARNRKRREQGHRCAECDAHKAAGFVSFEAFLSRRVGISSDQAKAVLDAKPSVKVAAVLRNVGRPKGGKQRNGHNVDNINISCSGGSDPAYLAARLRRDHPDAVFDEAVRGSVRQAAIAAGIVKVPSVLDQLRKLWAKASESDRRAFMDEVTDGR